MSARTHRVLETATAILAVTLLTPSATTLAQEQVGTAHSLDNNLRLGSGGYNAAGNRAYGAGRGGGGGGGGGRPFRDQLYRGQHGHIDYFTAFQDQRRYDPGRSSAMRDDPTRFQEDGSGQGSRFADGYDKGYEAGLADGAGADELPESAQRQMEEISYALGFFLGEEVRAGLDRDQVEADLDAVLRGFRDALFENIPRLPRSVIEDMLAELKRDVESVIVEGLAARDPDFRAMSEQNLQQSLAFHEDFGRREGVVTLDNGIQYQVIVEGAGPNPDPDDDVVLNYRVIQLDGSVVSEGTGESVRVGSTVEGAALALQLMNAGARWRVAIPPELAHGAGGNFPEVGPNVTLFCEIEMVEISGGDSQ